MATARRPAKRVSKSKSKAKAPAVVQLLINGQSSGTVDPAHLTIGEAANNLAREHGLKSYSILIDGTKVTTEGAGKPLAGASSLEVFAKETRG